MIIDSLFPFPGCMVLYLYEAGLQQEAEACSPQGLVDWRCVGSRSRSLSIDHIHSQIHQEAPSCTCWGGTACLCMQAHAKSTGVAKASSELGESGQWVHEQAQTSSRGHCEHNPNWVEVSFRKFLTEATQDRLLCQSLFIHQSWACEAIRTAAGWGYCKWSADFGYWHGGGSSGELPPATLPVGATRRDWESHCFHGQGGKHFWLIPPDYRERQCFTSFQVHWTRRVLTWHGTNRTRWTISSHWHLPKSKIFHKY